MGVVPVSEMSRKVPKNPFEVWGNLKKKVQKVSILRFFPKNVQIFYVEIFKKFIGKIFFSKIFWKNIFFEKIFFYNFFEIRGVGGVIQPNWGSGVNEDLINISSSLHSLKFQNFQKSSMLRYCSKRKVCFEKCSEND